MVPDLSAVSFFVVQLSSAFTPRFTFKVLPDATRQRLAGFLDRIHESVRMLSVRLALCDLEAPGWGEPCFRIVLLLLPGSQIVVWHFVVCFWLLFYIAIPIPEVIQCYHLFVHLPIVHELSSCPPAVMFLVLVSGLCCLLVGVFVSVCLGFGVCFCVAR